MASSSAVRPMPLAAEATTTGARTDSRTPLCRQASSSCVADLLLAQVLLEHDVVGLGRRLEQLVPAAGDLVRELVGNRDLDLRVTLEPVGLAMDEVDVAAERVRRADRQVERRDLGAERLAQRVERPARIRVLAVALVEQEAGRGPGRARRARRPSRARPRRRPRRPRRSSAPSAAWKP